MLENDVPTGMEFDEKDMRKDLDWAIQNRLMFGAFNLLSKDKSLYARKFFCFPDFELALADMQNNAVEYFRRKSGPRVTHARVYVLDGRRGKSEFHGFEWMPVNGGGHGLTRIDYRDEYEESDPYAGYAMMALMEQKGPQKVSTVARAAWAKIGDKVSDLYPTADYPKAAHMILLRKTLLRMSHLNPCIMRTRGNDVRGHDTMIEHLGIYDQQRRWFF
ncbi:hypothetical protein [uncultured Ruegeria sp.]|uniref:hypothetical protein n=1 Tax=uncultured Ruegeria sp. TaxID=259304 RepID=UPI00261957FA|nr:hypothetical protein [uncultured Ruegeria sp.]